MKLRAYSMATLLTALTLQAFPAGAQQYPSKPIKMAIGLAPGGAVDMTGRLLAQKLSAQMGVSVVVENRAGANGVIAHDYVAKAAPDGYTIVFNSGSLVQSHALSSKASYDPVRDFSPVVLFSTTPMMLVMNAKVPATNMAEFLRYANANPDKLSYGSAGTGNISHLATLLFLQAAGIKAVHIPYKGAAPAVADVIAGQVQMTTMSPASFAPLAKDKRLRPLVVMAAKRSKAHPDVPTLAESGIPNVEASSWVGVMAPAKTPRPVIARLNAETLTALQDPGIRAALERSGSEPLGSTPEQYAAHIKRELEIWTKIIVDNGIRLD